MQRLTSSTTTLLLLAGCAGLSLTAAAPALQAQPQPAEQAEAANPGRIRLVNINGYAVIDREHLVLNGGASRHYLVTLRHSCSGLHSGVRIGTSFPATATIHSPHMEYITVDDGPMNQRCYIDTIEPVDSVDAARALIDRRAEEAAGEDTPS